MGTSGCTVVTQSGCAPVLVFDQLFNQFSNDRQRMVASHTENKDLYLKIRVDVSGVHQKRHVTSHHWNERPGSLKSGLDTSLSTRFLFTVNYECISVSRKDSALTWLCRRHGERHSSRSLFHIVIFDRLSSRHARGWKMGQAGKPGGGSRGGGRRGSPRRRWFLAQWRWSGADPTQVRLEEQRHVLRAPGPAAVSLAFLDPGDPRIWAQQVRMGLPHSPAAWLLTRQRAQALCSAPWVSGRAGRGWRWRVGYR